MAGATYFCTRKCRGLVERETEQRFEFPTPLAVGEGSPPPSPSHSSGEGETGSPDFQGYLKAAQTSSVYYLCQTAALDNSLRSTLILMLEVFRIKKRSKNHLSGRGPKHGAVSLNMAPTRDLCPSGALAGGQASYPIALKM